MKIPFFWLALALTIGFVLNRQFAINGVILWTLFLVTVPLLWCARGSRVFLPLMLIAVAALSWIYSIMRCQSFPNAVEKWAGAGKIHLEGVVISVPQIQKAGRREKISFVLASRNLNRRHEGRSEQLDVRGKAQVFLFQSGVLPEYGDHVRIWCDLVAPPPAMNPGNFDYQKYLEQRSIRVICQGYGKKCLKILKTHSHDHFIHWLAKARNYLRERIDSLFERPYAVLFKALILGDRKEIPSALNNDFMKSGTSHLIAISGMNIALVIGSFYVFLIVCHLPQKMAACAGLLGTFAYVLIAGGDVPVARAGWMAGVMFLSLLFERERNSLNTFFLAYSILIIVDPKSMTYISFQLSFLSVFALIIMLRGMTGSLPWAEAFLQTIAASLGTFPLVIFYFNLFSPASIFANLLAIPFFHLALLSTFLALIVGAIPVIGNVAVRTAQFCLQCGLHWIHFWTQVPWGYFYLETPSRLQIACYYLLLVFMAGVRFTRFSVFPWIQALSVGLFLVIAFSFFKPCEHQTFRMTFLAMGKNEAIHIQFENRSQWLINTGRNFPNNQEEWLIAPYLRSKGVRHLTGVILADWYQKHCGGVPSVLRDFIVDYLFCPFMNKEKGQRVSAGISGKINKVYLKPGDRISAGKDGEISVVDAVNGQLVLKVTSRNYEFLILPSLNEKIIATLDKHSMALRNIELLFLPSSLQAMEADLERLSAIVAPSVIAVVQSNPGLTDFAHDRDIQVFDIQQSGALSVTTPQAVHSSFPSGKLQVSSFLQGNSGFVTG
jgi:competence protein ComEC